MMRRNMTEPGGEINPGFEGDGGADGAGKKGVTFTGLNANAMASKPFTPLKKKSSLLSLWSNDSRDQKLSSLKQELELDEHRIPLAAVLARYNTDPTNGLTPEFAAEKLAIDGPNCLKPIEGTPKWIKFLKKLIEGFHVLLWFGALLCLVAFFMEYSSSPEPSYDNMWLALILIFLVLFTSVFTFYEENKSANIMDSFKNMIPQSAECTRAGQKMTVKVEDLVLGDLIDVKFGDRLPADILILSSSNFKVDNSSLTGESEPQSRSPEFTHINPLETKNLAFFSSSAVEGLARGIVIRTGDNTVMGRIASLTSGVEAGPTPMAREIQEFIHLVSFIAISTGSVIFTIAMILGYSWINSVIFLIGIVMAYVPQGLVPTVAILLTLTAQRMARKNCLVKNLQGVETLGSTSTICSDKTGTLTQNRMTVAHVWFDDTIKELDTTETQTSNIVFDNTVAGWKTLSRVGKLCSRAEFVPGQERKPLMKRDVKGDASEQAILKCVEAVDGRVVDFRREYPLVVEIPFNSTNKFQVSIHRMSGNDKSKYLLVMKGAAEKITAICSTIMVNGIELPMTDEWKKRIDQAYMKLGSLGERVIGFCDLELPVSDFPEGFQFDIENLNFPLKELRFVGLMAMIDPPRAAVPDAVRLCRSAGIRVVMVTGDHPITAAAIARSVGIISPGNETIEEIAERMKVQARDLDPKMAKAIVIHGADLAGFDQDQLDNILKYYPEIVFARTSPQQKLIIVEGFQRLGAIVAVTGDGVNDSPALKKADIGIAMGITGSDVSKQAADMILLDDNFASIVTGVEQGRLVFDNLKKSIAYTMISKIPELAPFVVFIVANFPLMLGAIPILCVDLGSDLVPAISFAYERPESDIMKRPARNIYVDKLVGSKLLEVSFWHTGMFEAFGCFFVVCVILGENGFLPYDLLDLRSQWDSKAINDLKDSYGQEWTYYARKELEKTCYAAFYASIVIQQICGVLTRKTRRASVFTHGFANKFMNFSLLFETAVAAFFIYTPGLRDVIGFRPLRLTWWLPSIPFSICIIFVWEELKKWWCRRFPGGWGSRELYY